MSLVNYHESYGFDSLQKTSWWYDDFEGDSIKDYWRLDGIGSGTVVDGITGAAVRLLTGATTNNYHSFDWNSIRSLLASKNIALEWRLKLETIEDIKINITGLENTGADNLYVNYDPASGDTVWNINHNCTTGGGAIDVSTGVAPDTEWHNFRIQCHTHGAIHAHFYIDDDPTDNSPVTTGIPALYFDPNFNIATKEDVAHYMDIDYIAWRQDR